MAKLDDCFIYRKDQRSYGVDYLFGLWVEPFRGKLEIKRFYLPATYTLPVGYVDRGKPHFEKYSDKAFSVTLGRNINVFRNNEIIVQVGTFFTEEKFQRLLRYMKIACKRYIWMRSKEEVEPEADVELSESLNKQFKQFILNVIERISQAKYLSEDLRGRLISVLNVRRDNPKSHKNTNLFVGPMDDLTRCNLFFDWDKKVFVFEVFMLSTEHKILYTEDFHEAAK